MPSPLADIPTPCILPPPACWLRVWAAAWFALLLAAVGAAHAVDVPRWSAPAALSNLGTGPASTAVLDPVRALAIDIAEHLPTEAAGSVVAPLPLHPPWLTPDSQMLDDLQGVEWAGLWPPAIAATPPLQHPVTADIAGFLSTDPRRRDRPPTSSDLRRP